MTENKLAYKTFIWSLGTTSFRRKDLNLAIEEQLKHLENFWNSIREPEEQWSANNELQSKYYNYLANREFVKGNANNKAKDARQLTSPLEKLGLVDENRHITQVGKQLLKINASGKYIIDNSLEISNDSFIYLKQLLKTSYPIENSYVRPMIIVLKLLSIYNTLSYDECCYLLPLCVNENSTNKIINGIKLLRENNTTIDEIIIDCFMSMDNYKYGLQKLLDSTIADENLICEIGINRKSPRYDKSYYPLYKILHSYFFDEIKPTIEDILNIVQKLRSSVKAEWMNVLFGTNKQNKIKKLEKLALCNEQLQSITTEKEYKIVFFQLLHLFKTKATLQDYFDLNKRYLNLSNIILFDDKEIKLDIIPKHFFNSHINELYDDAYIPSTLIYDNCKMSSINNSLVFDDTIIINGVNEELGTKITTIEEAKNKLDELRYNRFNNLIKDKFTNEKLLQLLKLFKIRDDDKIHEMTTDNADIPTIFEYTVGIIWYKISNYQGKILDYMKLSLDANLLPITHASGGTADIVYKYRTTSQYLKHDLLIEVTLTSEKNQRRMEMEPVERHLGEYILSNQNTKSYCIFIAPYLNPNVVNDFMSKKFAGYIGNNYEQVSSMKIIPISTDDLTNVILNKYDYNNLYIIFENAYNHITYETNSNEWYNNFIKAPLEQDFMQPPVD